MEDLLFLPWIGHEYGNSKYGKLLIIGESHYQYEIDIPNFTINTIKKLGKLGDNDFYIKVGAVFNPNDYLDIWSKVAFANGIQYLYEEPREEKTKEQLNTIEPAIKKYLELTKPTKMIVFSKSIIWEKGLPNSLNWGTYVEVIEDMENKLKFTVWRFEYEYGHCYGLGAIHPSSTNPKFYSEQIKGIVDIFLARNYE